MPPSVRDVMPEVYAELEALVEAVGDPSLADHLEGLTGIGLGKGPVNALGRPCSARARACVEAAQKASPHPHGSVTETDAGQRVVRVLNELGVGGQ
jgi:hypothetical protein